MDLTRRRLLSLLPAAGALTAISQLSAHAAADRDRLLTNLVDMVAGTAETNARPELAAKLASIDRTARPGSPRWTAPAPGNCSRACRSAPTTPT